MSAPGEGYCPIRPIPGCATGQGVVFVLSVLNRVYRLLNLRGVGGIQSQTHKLREEKYLIDSHLSKAKFLVLEIYFIQIPKRLQMSHSV